ncbi:pneumococcal serine-rich repeat protein-like [Ischnura elegans]|uniref:pneumococcal serine-rich repeat protein-like n=1 Tax=Ischnura elegans TaxID=197161 RepID=UPI001ED8AF81|nr:pneumococcal serine-rich repeat protein-like [Ischnura elegans]
MAHSGAVGYGSPWVGHVAPPSPRVLPRPAPPPRPSRAAAATAEGGVKGAAPDTPPVKGPEHSVPWDSPSSTASSAYFSYSSTSPSCMSPPPAFLSSPKPHPCGGSDNIPASPLQRAGEGSEGPTSAARNLVPNSSEAKKPTPAPRSAVKVERCAVTEDEVGDALANQVEIPPEPERYLEESYSDDEEEEEKEESSRGDKSFRRPSEGTGTSVIRRRATVEVRSVAVQTPTALMVGAFESRATYPRTKGQSHHWRSSGKGGAQVSRSMDGEDVNSTSLVLTPKKKTSAPACEYHCSFVGEASVNSPDEATEKGIAASGVEITADEGVRRNCESFPRRGSEPSVDRKVGGEDVAAAESADSREEVVARAGSREAATVAKASASHQRLSSRAEISPAPQVAHCDAQVPSHGDLKSTSDKSSATISPVNSVSIKTSSSTKSQIQPSSSISSNPICHSTPNRQSTIDSATTGFGVQSATLSKNPGEQSRPITNVRSDSSCANSVSDKPSNSSSSNNPDIQSSPNSQSSKNDIAPLVGAKNATVNNRVHFGSQTSVNSQQSSSSGDAQSTPPSPKKPTTPPAPARRLQSPKQSPKLPQRQSEPSSPTVKYGNFKHLESSTPTRLQSTPKSSPPIQADPCQQSPLTHWLSELRSSKDAVEDEEGGVTMEEKVGKEVRPQQEAGVELRGGVKGVAERSLNRTRRGSGGEISIYEDACSCLEGECCCGVDVTSFSKKDCDNQGGPEASKVGGYKGIWGMDGAALDGVDGVCIRGGLRARGEGIASRLSALGLDNKSSATPEGNKEPERKVSAVSSSLSRRTISEGMAIMGKGKFGKEFGVKDKESPPEKEEPKTNGVARKTSSNLYSPKAFRKTSKNETEDGTSPGSPTSQTAKSPMNGKPPSGSPNSVSAQPVTRSLPEDDDDWPRRSKFTEDDLTCDDGDGLIIIPGTPEGHRSRISQSDSFRSTTSSESKLSSASASSSSQEIPTTGGYGNNNNTSTSSAKSSSCDNVSLSSSSSVGDQPRPLNLPPRVKPPRKNIKPKEHRQEGEKNATAITVPSAEAEEKVKVSTVKTPSEAPGKGGASPKIGPKSTQEVVESSSKTSTSSGDDVRSAVSSTAEYESPPVGARSKSSSTEKFTEDKGSKEVNEKDSPSVKSGAAAAWEAGRGKRVACPVAPPSPRLPPAKPTRDKPSVASSSGDSKGAGGGPRLSEAPSDGGSELSLESPKRGDEEEGEGEEEMDEEEDEEEVMDGEECEDAEESGDWKGVYVRGRRKGSYSSDIEAWKRGLSGWCSVEDEEEFLESTKFDAEESSLSVGCGTPDRSAEEWYSSNDMEGRVYFFEENSNESSWTLPEVTVVSQPQTPPPVAVSGSPAGSDSFISGRSSGGEEGSRDAVERGGSSHSVGSGMVGVSRDDMVAMPIVKMKMDQWEKGGRLIQLRDNSLEKDLRGGGRSTRAAKTRSMVIGEPGTGEVKIPLPVKVPSAKDWPQLWDGNMYVLKEGTLNKTKITENKKRVRKNWAPSHVVLTELFLLFFKDAKTFTALKSGSLGGNVSPGDSGAMPELCVDLNGALVDRDDQLSSRRNVFRVSTVLGLQVLCQDDNAQNVESWYQSISGAISKLPSGFDGSPRQQNPVEIRNFLEPNSPDEQKKFPRIGRSKSVKVKKDASMEDLSSTNSTERQVKIKARLKKFFHRRPTMETLVKKGIWKDEPAFGSYLEQVSGEGIPRIPLFVQRCIAAIESKPENMKADGLYRASGNLSQVQKIRLQVDQNNLSIVDMEEDVHVLTGALKLFFRELKEPLIPYSLFNRALTASTNSNKKEQLHEFKEIVKILPVANYDTLKYLLQHLLRVTSYQDFNRMHIANLAIVFGPTLMWPKQESLNMALDLMQQNLVIECLLQEFDTIFSTGR